MNLITTTTVLTKYLCVFSKPKQCNAQRIKVGRYIKQKFLTKKTKK